jgi:hypothetical protein
MARTRELLYKQFKKKWQHVYIHGAFNTPANSQFAQLPIKQWEGGTDAVMTVKEVKLELGIVIPKGSLAEHHLWSYFARLPRGGNNTAGSWTTISATHPFQPDDPEVVWKPRGIAMLRTEGNDVIAYHNRYWATMTVGEDTVFEVGLMKRLTTTARVAYSLSWMQQESGD